MFSFLSPKAKQGSTNEAATLAAGRVQSLSQYLGISTEQIRPSGLFDNTLTVTTKREGLSRFFLGPTQEQNWADIEGEGWREVIILCEN